MAGDTDILTYPRARVALDNGDLVDVTNVKLDSTNNAKLVHTLRRSPAGVVLGNHETTVSMDVAVSEEGLEREYLDMVRTGTVKQVRLKVPGKTLTVEGKFSDFGIEGPVDAEIKTTLKFIGKLTDD